MRLKVLVSAPYMVPVLDRFADRFEAAGIEVTRAKVIERLAEQELLPQVGDVDGIICGDDEFSERVFLAAAPRLKVISKWGTGIDSIDLVAARRLGVRVYNTPNAFTEAVADTTVGYVLAFGRRLVEMTEQMRRGHWQKAPCVSMQETTLGIVGVGCIGTAVARRARAFGMRILGNDIRPIAPAVVAETGLEPASLECLIGESDFVTLHCDLNPTSHHLMNEERLALMRRAAFLVNTARGPVVDEAALAAALAGGRIAGAALDVFECEPLPAGSPLRRLPNVMLSPHNANSSPRAWRAVHERTVQNLLLGLGVDNGRAARE